ncbi:hypothetical protein QT937_013450 [Xanthomonas campestris pv. campestris]|uniref:hypothetical protein n=1 Tax=Xanthomonas campestris TaxID=339 RepID=UPI0025A1F664|nr:hypothetical protein [Xanthomonas campestris]MDM7696043.1 hypothetical protein [Xanthomonas campestris pv. campestris]
MSAAGDNEVERILNKLVDELAGIEHARWAYWQAYVHSQGVRREDGTLVLPAELVLRWDRQIATPYKELSPDEQAADRDQVMRYLPTIRRGLAEG